MSKKPLSQKVFEETADKNSHNTQEWEKTLKTLMATTEELLPELKAAIDGEYIRHPLLVDNSQPTAHNNFIFLSRRRKIEKAEQEGDWFDFVFTHEKPFRVDAFKEVQSKMDDKKYWEILSSVYVNSENLRQNQGSIRRLLTANRPHREAMMSDKEKTVFDDLPETVTIFRGYGHDNSHGWSWSISREKAEWFSNRFAVLGGVPRVATGKVQRTDIIAYLDGREEKEIVCDPKCIVDYATERLDGKEDKPRIPREDKFEFNSYSQTLKMHMEQNPLLLLSELRSAFEQTYEEAITLIEHHGEEKLSCDIDRDSVDSQLLKNEIKAIGEAAICDIPGNIEEAADELDILIEDHSDETLCGDFDL